MESKAKFKPDSSLKLMDQVRQVLRYYHYAYRTEQTYCDWIVRFIRFHGSKRHPKDMGKSEVEAFLSHLATDRKVSASTQRQALNAIVFLYRDVLEQAIQGEIAPVRASGRGAQRKGNSGSRSESTDEVRMEFISTNWYRYNLKHRPKEDISWQFVLVSMVSAGSAVRF